MGNKFLNEISQIKIIFMKKTKMMMKKKMKLLIVIK